MTQEQINDLGMHVEITTKNTFTIKIFSLQIQISGQILCTITGSPFLKQVFSQNAHFGGPCCAMVES